VTTLFIIARTIRKYSQRERERERGVSTMRYRGTLTKLRITWKRRFMILFALFLFPTMVISTNLFNTRYTFNKSLQKWLKAVSFFGDNIEILIMGGVVSASIFRCLFVNVNTLDYNHHDVMLCVYQLYWCLYWP